MVDMIGVIIIAIVYFFIVSSGKKKITNQKKTAEKTTSARQQHTQPPKTKRKQTADPQMAQRAQKTQKNMPSRLVTDMEKARIAEGEDPCHSDMLSPAQIGMRLDHLESGDLEGYGEGEDPCHVGSAPASLDASYSIFTEDLPSAFSENDIVRSVMMSEILMRPQERAALRRIRRRGA